MQAELFRHLYNLVAILNQAIDSKAMIEDSVGQHCSTYARGVIGLPDAARCKYLHLCRDGRNVYAWTYPIMYLTTFMKRLWFDYFPKRFPAYQQYRAKHSSLPAPGPKKLIH